MQCVWIFKRYFKSTIVNPDNVTAIYIQVLFQFSIQCKTAYKKNLFPYIWNMYREETTHSVLKIMLRNETLQCCNNWLPVQYITVIWFLLTWYPVYAIWTITRLISVYTVLHHLLESRQSGINFRNLCWAVKRITVISCTKKKKKRSHYVIIQLKGEEPKIILSNQYGNACKQVVNGKMK